MKDQGIPNKTQFTTQKKRVETGSKMKIDIPNRVIYMVTSTFKNKYEELKEWLLWFIFNQIFTTFSGSKDMLEKDCLNIGLV